jgi:glycosyltransferase involved in cell wall biosynthesis
MGMPEVSVVIPTYRRPALLLTCLRFLEDQTLDKDKFEVIVVGDGPDQSTMSAIVNFKARSELRLTYMNTLEKKDRQRQGTWDGSYQKVIW